MHFLGSELGLFLSFFLFLNGSDSNTGDSRLDSRFSDYNTASNNLTSHTAYF